MLQAARSTHEPVNRNYTERKFVVCFLSRGCGDARTPCSDWLRLEGWRIDPEAASIEVYTHYIPPSEPIGARRSDVSENPEQEADELACAPVHRDARTDTHVGAMSSRGF
ncbi:hypothetical protein ISCGN_025978 [Ixodes scapularis]